MYTSFIKKSLCFPVLIVLSIIVVSTGFADDYLELVELDFPYMAKDINDNNQVAGNLDSETPVLWEEGSGFTYIVDTTGTLDTFIAVTVNNSGHVGGYAKNSARDRLGFYWDGDTVTSFDVFGESKTRVTAMNDNNATVGTSRKADREYYAFLRAEDGSVQYLGAFGTEGSDPQAINNKDEVAGYSERAEDEFEHAFLWSGEGGMQDLGTLGGNESWARGINDATQVVGRSEYIVGNKNPEAFVWENGTMTGLGFLIGDQCSAADDINNLGQIVGYSKLDRANGDNHAVLWQNGEIIDLNDLIDPSSEITLSEGMAINDNSVILVCGYRGVDTTLEYFLLDVSSLSGSDSDCDGIADDDDNCPATANVGQIDSDGDGYGNACDCDIDGDNGGDGWVNYKDFSVFRSAYGTSEGDSSWNDDADFDGDRMVNYSDYLLFRARYGTSEPFE